MVRQPAYFVWEFNTDDERRKTTALAHPGQVEDVWWHSGDRITRTLAPIDFVIDPSGLPLDYEFNLAGLPLVSPNLQTALAKAGVDNLQYFDTRFLTSRGRVLRSDYKVANVVGLVACFDWDRSVYDDRHRADGLAIHIEKLVIDLRRVRGKRLFRIEEAQYILIVARDVRDALDAAAITGIKFTAPDDYRG